MYVHVHVECMHCDAIQTIGLCAFVCYAFFVYRGIKTHVSSTCAIIGQPRSMALSTAERAAFESINICIPDHIMTYPHLLLTEKDRLITSLSSSKAVKRNNSCVMYRSSETNQFGVLVKLCLVDSTYFALLRTLHQADLHLCQDSVTDAKLNQHVIAFHPPRCVPTMCIYTIDYYYNTLLFIQ